MDPVFLFVNGASIWGTTVIFYCQETQRASPGAAASISDDAREFIMVMCDNQSY